MVTFSISLNCSAPHQRHQAWPVFNWMPPLSGKHFVSRIHDSRSQSWTDPESRGMKTLRGKTGHQFIYLTPDASGMTRKRRTFHRGLITNIDTKRLISKQTQCMARAERAESSPVFISVPLSTSLERKHSANIKTESDRLLDFRKRQKRTAAGRHTDVC